MTDEELLGQWLDRELAGVPQELAVRIRGALPPNWRDVPNSDAAALMANAAAHELRGLLERGCETRWAAPGLLTVDALVTYACELLAFRDGDIDSGAMEILDTIVRTFPADEGLQ